MSTQTEIVLSVILLAVFVGFLACAVYAAVKIKLRP